MRRLKYVASINDETLAETTDADYEFEYVDIGNVDAAKGIVGRETHRFENAPSRARRIVRAGDTIVSTVRTYLRAIAAIREPGDRLIVSTGFAVVRPRGIDASYLSYALRSPYFVETVVSRSTGVSYPAVNASEVGNIEVPVPSVREQRAIAAFLDRQTGKIDALVEKKRRLIELLKEKRAALISHAVTKGEGGLAGTACSGASVWTRMRLGRAIKLQRGIDITGAADGGGAIPVFSSGGLSGYCDTPMARGPGVIVGRKGTLGTVHYSESDYWPHDTTLWVREFRGSHPRYVFYFLLHLKLERFDVGAANPTLNRNHVHPLVVDWPDVTTQQVVATFLDDRTAELDSLAAKVNLAIDRLLEYRTALISAAVTGKIDVRGEVAS